jgi:hypothetical protein
MAIAITLAVEAHIFNTHRVNDGHHRRINRTTLSPIHSSGSAPTTHQHPLIDTSADTVHRNLILRRWLTRIIHNLQKQKFSAPETLLFLGAHHGASNSGNLHSCLQ